MYKRQADTVVVGRFAGQQALAAVGATGSLCFLLIALFNGLSMGSNVLIARYIGAGNHEKIEKSVHTSIAMSIYCGLFLVVAGFFLSRPMLELMSTPSDIIDMSELYMRIYFVSALDVYKRQAKALLPVPRWQPANDPGFAAGCPPAHRALN